MRGAFELSEGWGNRELRYTRGVKQPIVYHGVDWKAKKPCSLVDKRTHRRITVRRTQSVRAGLKVSDKKAVARAEKGKKQETSAKSAKTRFEGRRRE